MIGNASRFKILVTVLALAAVEAWAQPQPQSHAVRPQYLQLSQAMNLRVGATSGQNRYLHAFTTLPVGTVVEVDSNSLSQPHNYYYGSDLRQSRHGFIQGVRVIKVPGRSSSELGQWNRHGLYLSASEIQTARPVKVVFASRPAWEALHPSRLFRAITGANEAAVNRANYGLNGVQAINRRTYCSNCTSAHDARSAGQGVITPLNQAATRPQAPTSPGVTGRASLSGYGLAPSCGNFMSSNGTIGPWGKSVVSTISRPEYKSSFFASNALGRMCPKFGSLSAEKKAQAWVWFWASLADEESGCNPKIVHPTHTKSGQRINRVEGYGLFAAERHYGDRDHRGAACKSISTAEQQSLCAIDTMYVHHFRQGHTAYRSSGSYWGPIHRANTQLIPHMRRFQGCF
jgi:hypothetical protein